VYDAAGMIRRAFVLASIAVSSLAARNAIAQTASATTAVAPAQQGDITELGAWFGPRVFSGSSGLGYVTNAPFHLTLASSVEIGARVARPFLPWLVPEIELGFVPTHTTSFDTTVYWFEPRIQLRFELMPHNRLMPFLLIGGGATIVLSTARPRYDNDLQGDGYAGGGFRFDTGKGVTFRLDARLSLVPGMPGGSVVVPEGEVGIGVEFHPGERRGEPVKPVVVVGDRDGDHIPDDKDQCPDRPEDYDGFQDADGCPDIDNDNDGILDQFDKCPNVPETYNGYQDEDGCPDTVPPDLDAIKGTIEGLLYAEGETAVRDSAQPHLKKIADVLLKYPGVKIVLTGYTDDREFKAFAPAPDPKNPNPEPPDFEGLAADLSRARAEAVRLEMVKLGIGEGKITVDGKGAETPVSDNSTPRGRLANRRVELQLFVPQGH
jgi:outer membrane protein OmpA-like peptidoglycan-associated protein